MSLKELQEEGDKALEHFASLEHERWAKWQKYLHSKLYPLGESESSLNGHLLVLPTELYQRWERQIATPYSELSEKEKESDREQVRPYLSFLHLQQEKAYTLGLRKGAEEERDKIGQWLYTNIIEMINSGEEIDGILERYKTFINKIKEELK